MELSDHGKATIMVLICLETKSKSCIVSKNAEQRWELPPMNGVVSCAPSRINSIKLDECSGLDGLYLCI